MEPKQQKFSIGYVIATVLALLTPIMVDRAAFEKCLESRGYSRAR